ncbi:MAG: phage major capsid protein [Candidatus Nanopelagicales bacterium]
MANPNVGQRIASNWEAVVKTKPEDQIHDDYWTLNRLSKGEGFLGLSGGDFISGPIEYALNGSVAAYTDADIISTTRNDVFDRYEYQWKEYAGSVVISDLERDRNAGEGQVFALLPAKLDNLKNSMRSTLNADIMGTAAGNEMNGLQDLISATPTTGTVGAISRDSYTFWRNQQTAGTQTTSAFDNLRASMRSIYNLCSNGVGDQHPSFAVTTRTVFEGYDGLLLANERFTDKGTGDGDFKNEVLKFKGAAISYDNDCLSGALYFLNPKFIKLVYKTGQWMKMLPGVRPSNQTIEVMLTRTMCQLIATNPRRLGVVTSIT